MIMDEAQDIFTLITKKKSFWKKPISEKFY